jgi:hypothetical protein
VQKEECRRADGSALAVGAAYLEQTVIGLAETTQDEVDLRVELVSSELRSPALEDAMSRCQNTVVDSKVVCTQACDEFLCVRGANIEHSRQSDPANALGSPWTRSPLLLRRFAIATSRAQELKARS